MKKALLKQDALLLGSHPAAMRGLVAQFANALERETECVSITRDTTESDLKQRRELSGGSVLYINQPVVNAALHGRLLVIEGLEKAERNLLPVINNLLENREMALEDGSLLIHPDRFDSLLRQGMTHEELAEVLKILAMYDTNNDGYISETELAPLISALKVQATMEEVTEMLDSDGNVSPAAFLMWYVGCNEAHLSTY